MPTKTKGDIVNKAYAWLRISGLTKKPQPNEIESALDVLEGMAYELDSRNICTSFEFEDIPDPATESGIDNAFFLAAAWNLGVRMASDFGKALTPDQLRLASQAMSNWSARTFQVNPIGHPRRQARGSGNNFRGPNWIRFYKDGRNPPISCETEKITRGSTNNYTYTIVDYLQDGETVTNRETSVSAGLTVIEDEFVSPTFAYQISCAINAQNAQKVQFKVTTSFNRVQTFDINFNAIGTASAI